ncbi:MAG: hypothetical protein QOH58_157 [Thermoleophilaceae bacterium]|nr:hypothetical protein [Thermoleophilaceae bacterium]
MRSPQRLLDSLAPGQTGCLRGGTYTADYNILSTRRGGSPGAPLTLRSYPGERAKLVGIIDIAQGADYITLSGLAIEGTGAGGANTVKVYSRGVVIENNDITNAWHGRSCLMLGNISGGGQAVGTVVRGNTFHECGDPANGTHDHAIYASNISGGEIVSNLFYNSAAYTIQLYPNAHNTRFAHNVVDGGDPSVRGGLVFGGDGSHASSNNLVENNIITHAATSAITSYWEGPVGTGNVARNNCVWGSRGGPDITRAYGFASLGNTVANPAFTSRASRDYRLTAASPCTAMLRGAPTSAPEKAAVKRKRIRHLRRLTITLRSLRAAARASGRGHKVRRVELRGRVRGATTGRISIVVQRRNVAAGHWGRQHVRVVRLRGKARYSVTQWLRPGRYRAWAKVRDADHDRAAHSKRVRFRA